MEPSMTIARLAARAVVLALVLLQACSTNMKQTPAALSAQTLATPAVARPPVAAKRPHAIESPNGTRSDEYYWLRDDTRANPEMLGYVNAENSYADAMLAHVKPLEETLYKEIV